MYESKVMTIDRAEALWQLGLLPIGKLHQVAMEALAAGHYGPALQELAEFPLSTQGDLGDLFERALKEMNRTPLSKREAAIKLAKAIATEIVSGRVDPYAGARKIWWELWENSGRPSELTIFVGLAAQYEDDPEHRQDYSSAIFREAENLVRQ